MPNYITLANHEARRLAGEGSLLVVRPVVPQPTHGEPEPTHLSWWSWNDTCAGTTKAALHNTLQAWSPLGAPGDVLVCKEAWLTLSGRDGKEHCLYRADTPYGQAPKWHTWIPSTQMPHEYVRFRPIVREAGVMRTGDVSSTDIESMGIAVSKITMSIGDSDGVLETIVAETNTRRVAAYWNHRFRKYPWESNPWCWTAWVETPEAAARDEWAQREADKRRAMLEDMWAEEHNA